MVVFYDLMTFVLGVFGWIVSDYFYYELDVSEISFSSSEGKILIYVML